MADFCHVHVICLPRTCHDYAMYVAKTFNRKKSNHNIKAYALISQYDVIPEAEIMKTKNGLSY